MILRHVLNSEYLENSGHFKPLETELSTHDGEILRRARPAILLSSISARYHNLDSVCIKVHSDKPIRLQSKYNAHDKIATVMTQNKSVNSVEHHSGRAP